MWIIVNWIMWSVTGNARIYASSEIIEYVWSSVSFCELNKFVIKGNHDSPKWCSHEKTTTVVGSHWKVIRDTVENLSKDLHLYRSLDVHSDISILLLLWLALKIDSQKRLALWKFSGIVKPFNSNLSHTERKV